jgi:hypothetical protein
VFDGAGWRSKTVMFAGLEFAVLPIGAVLLDARVRPRPAGPAWPVGRSMAGLWLTLWLTATLFGLFLALCGNAPISAGLALAVLALLVLVSNAKHAMLGEPLLFSDLALVGAIFRHPQFYLSAITIAQRLAVGLGATVLLGVLSWLFVPALPAHLAGGALMAGSLAVLALSLHSAPFRRLLREPDAYADVRRHGLYATLMLYWLRWRESRDPPLCTEVARRPLSAAPELVVIVQCESFADPVELFGDPAFALPGLSFARENAWRHGRLEVSGFGAYTMRTEYGVLFGRDEDALGFRRYDPFLTALGEASYALPARLKRRDGNWRSLFVHPHDMRFYGRDRIMPAGGFTRLVGEDCFAPPGPGEGRYVTDAAVADEIMALAEAATEPTMLYAVTIENHGPWAPDGSPGRANLVQSYLHLVRKSDAMLMILLERLRALGRAATLVFFGDHRPSIPGATAPGGDRHTPYVIVRIDDAGHLILSDGSPTQLTPAGLHHAILDAVLGECES